MKRSTLIQIHLILASLFLPLLLLMPLTGTSYLLGFKGSEVKTEAFRSQDPLPSENKNIADFFKSQFQKQNIDFDFENVKVTPTEFILRPSTRTHYVAEKAANGSLIFWRIEPNLHKRLIEIHKGHGPKLMKYFEIGFGVALIMVTLSGLWLSLTVPNYRKATWISFLIGCVIIGLCLI